MKPNDICTIFANPAKCEHPIDKARLIKKLDEFGICEQWAVAYLNEPDKQYVALIKKNGTDNE